MKNSFDFKISDNIQNYNGYAIDVSGLDISGFIKNPVALFNHNPDKAIGLWSNINKTENELYGTVTLDTEDKEAIDIASKIERGIIKGCSMGTCVEEINNMPMREWYKSYDYNADKEMIITKSSLYEVSITPTPANKNAIKLSIKTNDGHKELNFNNKLELCAEIGKNINTQLKDMEKEIVSTEEILKEVIEDKVSVIEDTVNIIADKVVTTTDLIDYKIKFEDSLKDIDNYKIKLEDSINQINKVKKELSDSTIKFENLEKEVKNKEVDTFLKDSVRLGYLKTNQIEDFKKLCDSNFDLTKQIILKMPRLNPVSLTDKLVINDDRKDWNFNDWTKKDSVGLEKMRLDEPEKFKELFEKNNKK